MKTYTGSCHCGKVKFEINSNIDKVISCNCSICSKKGVLHHRVSPEQFSLLEGKEHLSLYQFDTKEARHFYCNTCGIHPFSQPRAAPESYSINIRCLDDFNLKNESFELIEFDGNNWEEAVKNLNENLGAVTSINHFQLSPPLYFISLDWSVIP